MKVKELIEKLREYDQELPILVSGYEGGVREKDVDSSLIKFIANINKEWYYGEHEDDKNGNCSGVLID